MSVPGDFRASHLQANSQWVSGPVIALEDARVTATHQSTATPSSPIQEKAPVAVPGSNKTHLRF